MRPGPTFLLISAVAACGQPGQTPDVDGSVTPGDPGIALVWRSQGTLPGIISPSVTVATASFAAHNIRLIGDAVSGDSRTTRNTVAVAWTAAGTPEPTLFPDAPTGLYSKVSFELDGKILDPSYQITGTVLVGGDSFPFVISDLDEIEISQSTSCALAPGGKAEIDVVMDLEPALAGVDFSTVRNDSGTLVLDNQNSQLSAFRSRVHDAFKVTIPSPK